MIKNIVFDIGGVLTEFTWDKMMSSLFDSETEKAVTDAMWGNPDWTEFDRGILSDEEVLQLFIKKSPQYENAIRTVFSRLGEIPHKKEGAIPIIETLKADGYKVYYLSNYFEYLMHVAPQALDFIPHTDGGVFSCYEHVVKPNHEIFAVLCERYGLKAEECIFTDDSLKNIESAEKFGMKTILYENQDLEKLLEEIKALAERYK